MFAEVQVIAALAALPDGDVPDGRSPRRQSADALRAWAARGRRAVTASASDAAGVSSMVA